MSIQTQITATTALGIIFSAGLSVVPAQAACIVNDCAALGYTKTSSECTGEAIHCPYDATKVYCATDTCGEPFYGVTKCPDNATCTSCTVGDKTFQKDITCNKDYVFLSDKMDCLSDLCPDGYARTSADCGTSGSSGWTLNEGFRKQSEAGNTCYLCKKKSCDWGIFNLQTCDYGCRECYEGDTLHYGCSAEAGMEMYQNKCLFVIVKDMVWQPNFTTPCCTYVINGRTEPCSALAGYDAYLYPVAYAILTCGTIHQNGYNYYYQYK